jgi:OmpA-OmpF porin, OOP family
MRGRVRAFWTASLAGVLALTSSSQNLIKDPGFEQPQDCPDRYTERGKPVAFARWWLPTAGTADRLTRCAVCKESAPQYCVGVPRNFAGFQQPHGGDGYAGIGLDMPMYAEYLQTQLSVPLKKGIMYRVEFWVSLADNSLPAEIPIGVYFTASRTHLDSNRPLTMAPHVRADGPLNDTLHWQRVAGAFTARGRESFLTIGHFPGTATPSKAKRRTSEKGPLDFSYYYIDDVLVEEVKEVTTTLAVQELPPSTHFVMSDVLFKTDESVLQPAGIAYLDSLCSAVLLTDDRHIRIEGHTDSTGSVEHNAQLSLQRAKSVAQHLIFKGVDDRRIMAEGKGDAIPLESNATEAGRARNRRVEITLLP